MDLLPVRGSVCHLFRSGGTKQIINHLSARLGVPMEPGSSMVAQGMQITFGASFGETVGVEILESDLDPAWAEGFGASPRSTWARS